MKRSYPEVRVVLDHLDNQADDVPIIFSRSLLFFNVRNNIVYKTNCSAMDESWLLLLPKDVQEDTVTARHDKSITGQLGYSRTVARLHKSSYGQALPR